MAIKRENVESRDGKACQRDGSSAEPPSVGGLAAGEYPVWSPYEAHEAAATLLDMLGPTA
jgi:hypothetical protein